MIKKVFMQLPHPTLEDQKADLDRVQYALGHKLKMGLSLQRRLPAILRENGFACTAVYSDKEILGIEPGNTTARQYGVAVDIGTTTVVAFLMNMHTGARLDVVSELNAQSSFGADVISRINHAVQNPDGLKQLQDRIISQLNRLISQLVKRCGLDQDEIYTVTLAGNTTMLHLATGLEVRHIAVVPFTPVVSDSQVMNALEYGLRINPAGVVQVLPNISGYVGGDIVAGILASRLSKQKKRAILLDVGTNGEIVFGNDASIVCCSTAAGPAFEGAQLKNGVAGISGAVSQVSFEDSVFAYQTIDKEAPIGICGSGIIDILAVLLTEEIVDETGRMMGPDDLDPKHPLRDRLVLVDDEPAFIVVFAEETLEHEPLYMTQKDVREIQLAKASIAAGIKTLVKSQNLSIEDVDVLYLAGGFGSYIDRGSAIKIGLIPAELESRVEGIGNAAGTGAVMSLLSRVYAQDACDIKVKSRYIELSSSPDFQNEYIMSMYFE